MKDLFIAYKYDGEEGNMSYSLSALKDPNLSWKEKGILTYIRTKENPTLQELIDSSSNGEKSVRSGLNKLIKKKYAVRFKIINKHSKKIVKWVYISFSKPTTINKDNLTKILSIIKSKKPDASFGKLAISPCSITKVILYMRELNTLIHSIGDFAKDDKITFSFNKTLGHKKRCLEKQEKHSLFDRKKNVGKKARGPVGEIIDYWNRLGLRQHKKVNTKVYQKAAQDIRKLLKGTFFEDGKYVGYKFKPGEIKASIRRFSVCVLDSNYSPMDKTPLKRMSLSDFIYHPRAKEGKYKSRFIMMLNEKPEPLKVYCSLKKDNYPKITNRIIDKYISITGATVNMRDSFTMNQFIRVSSMVKDFIEEYEEKLIIDTPVPILVDTLIEVAYNGSGDVDLFRLTSPLVFKTLLPQKLKQQKYLK